MVALVSRAELYLVVFSGTGTLGPRLIFEWELDRRHGDVLASPEGAHAPESREDLSGITSPGGAVPSTWFSGVASLRLLGHLLGIGFWFPWLHDGVLLTESRGSPSPLPGPPSPLRDAGGDGRCGWRQWTCSDSLVIALDELQLDWSPRGWNLELWSDKESYFGCEVTFDFRGG